MDLPHLTPDLSQIQPEFYPGPVTTSTRISHDLQTQTGGTPLREKNFLDFTMLIINIAFDLIRSELEKDGSPSAISAIEYLNEFISNCTVSVIEDAYERLQEERIGNFPLIYICNLNNYFHTTTFVVLL